jgi:hypothetical protein
LRNGDVVPTEEDAVFDQPGTIWHPRPAIDLVCPLCRSAIAIEDINVATDIALCRRCGKTFSFSELVGASAGAVPDLTAPPDGAWFEPLADGFRTGATTRSWMAVYLVPFTCVWSGMSLGGIYGKQISSGHFDPASSLFGLPFLIGSVFLIGYCLMTTMGKVELSQRSGNLSVFTGVGPLGWTRNYLWSDFSLAREETRQNGFNWNRRGAVIILEGKRRAAFGTMLSEERRYFVLSVLRQKLRNSNQTQTASPASPRFR